EEEYRQALRYAAVGKLAAGLTHDLNHLLTLIQANASLLATGLPLEAPQRALAAAVDAAAVRGGELTRRLGVFTRGDGARAEPAPLNAAVLEVTNLFRSVLDERVTLEVRLADRLPCVRAPASQLFQIALNLCLNARDAMPEGGRLEVTTDLVRLT